MRLEAQSFPYIRDLVNIFHHKILNNKQLSKKKTKMKMTLKMRMTFSIFMNRIQTTIFSLLLRKV